MTKDPISYRGETFFLFHYINYMYTFIIDAFP